MMIVCTRAATGVLVAAVLTLLVAAPSASAADPLTWLEPYNVNQASTAGPFDSVDCPSATQCTAGDELGNIATFDPFTGVAATGLHHIDDKSTARQALIDISCPSTTQCTAVDNVSDELTFDPTSATPAANPKFVNGNINGNYNLAFVDCPSTSQCTALDRQGAMVTFDPTAATPSDQSYLVDTLGDNYSMGGLSCPSTTQCTAVDHAGYAVTFDPTSTNPSSDLHLVAPTIGGFADSLVALDCPTTYQCTAMDNNGNQVTFHPVFWTSTVGHVADATYTRVMCPSTAQCTATYFISGVELGTLTFDPTSATPNGTATALDISARALFAVDCPAVNECVTVGGVKGSIGRNLAGLPVPSLSASAPASGTVGTAIAAASVSGVLSGGASPTKRITFKVFGPQASAPTSCGSGGAVVGTATVSGAGTFHPSAAFTPTDAGSYWWYASYSGDLNNAPASSTCGASMAKTVVAPALSATAPVGGAANSAISRNDVSASLSGATGATGTITFKVYGPQAAAPASCTAGGTTVGTASVAGSNTYHPDADFTPTASGTYWWYASYGGGGGVSPGASACGASMAKTVVANVAPSLTAGIGDFGVVGTPIGASDFTAGLAGGSFPTGTITFKAFGPQASPPNSCTTGGTTIGTATVSGNGDYAPPAFTPTLAGKVWFYASYSGDVGNAPAAAACGASMDVFIVLPSYSVAVPSTGTVNVPIPASAISATVTGGPGSSGTLTFKLLGPSDTQPDPCGHYEGLDVGTATVSGAGTYHPNAGTTFADPGKYWWYATYDDTDSSESLGACDPFVFATMTIAAAPPPPPPPPPADGTTSTSTSPSPPPADGTPPPPPPPAGGTTPPPPGVAATGDTVAPTFTTKVTATVGKRSARRRPVTLRFGLSENATVKLTLTRSAPGIRSGSKCVARPRQLPAHAKRCTRQVPLSTKSTPIPAGPSRSVSAGKLAVGSYRAVLIATDAARNVSRQAVVSFRVRLR